MSSSCSRAAAAVFPCAREERFEAPTPLVKEKERSPVPIEAIRTDRWRQLRALWLVGSWVCWAIWRKVTWRWSSEVNAKRVRSFMERMGFLWIKAGQLLSLRPDLFGPVLTKELTRLQYASGGFPPAVVRRTIIECLGAPPEEIFESFDETPFAAASVAQIHCARLKGSGAEVMVKCLRPNIVKIFRVDLRFFRLAAAVLSRIPRISYVSFNDALWELEKTAEEEADFSYEISNLRRFRKRMQRHGVKVPKVYTEYSADRLVVMERLEGPVMSQYIQMAESDPERLAQWCEENEIEPKKVAARLAKSFLRQLFEDNLFHGDLHPGNIILLRKGDVALIDLGSLCTAEQEFLSHYYFGLQAFGTGRYRRGVEHILAMSPKLPIVDDSALKEDLIRTVRGWERRTYLPNLPYHKKSISQLFMELAKVMDGYRVEANWALFQLDRSLMTLDASLSALGPDFSYTRIFREYYQERNARLFYDGLDLRKIPARLVTLQEMVSEYRLFIEPMLSGLGVRLSNKVSEWGAIARAVVAGVRRALVFGSLLLIAAEIYRRRPAGERLGDADSAAANAWEGVVAAIPAFEPWVLVLLGLGVGYIVWTINSLQKSFRGVDARD